jgi:hypothetical protein
VKTRDQAQEKLARLAKALDGRAMHSRRNVPYVAVERNGARYNVCYSSRANRYRVFCRNANRMLKGGINFGAQSEVISFIKRQ